MRIHLSLLAVGAACALGACQQAEREVATVEAAEAARSTAIAEAACVDAVAAEAGVEGVTVASAEESGGSAEVLLNVPGADLPWLCVASTSGQIANIAYTGAGVAG